jgi:asparagine synthase (glutamine-hydrolysing)
VGVWSRFEDPELARLIEAAKSTLLHRGPDSAGSFSRQGLRFRFHRLSIIDRSEIADQPMKSADSRYTMMFNGELYNFEALARTHLGNMRLRTKGDAEVALELICSLGVNALPLFRGMFAFAIWDEYSKSLTLARDRFGIKPMFWAQHAGRLLFSSEIKGILALGYPPKPNLAAVRRYLNSDQLDAGSTTFFEGIHRVEPGQILIFSEPSAAPVSRQWYRLPEVVPKYHGSIEDACNDLHDVLLDSCRLHTISDVGFGVNLSGGVDSSVLLALTESVANGQVLSFSVDYLKSVYSERSFVESLMEQSPDRRCIYTEIEETRALSHLASAIRSQDEPFGGVPTLAWYPHFANVRNNGCAVVLDGSGLDDLLGGYLKHVVTAYGSGAIESNDRGVREISDAWQVPEDEVRRLLDNWGRKHLSIDGTPAIFHALRPEFQIPSEDDPSGRHDSLAVQLRDSFGNSKLYRALRYKDRASMWHGVELRVPFVDHLVAEFCLSLPPRFLVRRGAGKWVLREAMKFHFASGLSEAPKRSVQSPQREWFSAGALGLALQASLRNPSDLLGRVLDIESASAQLMSARAALPKNSNALWQWLNLDLWAKAYL